MEDRAAHPSVSRIPPDFVPSCRPGAHNAVCRAGAQHTAAGPVSKWVLSPTAHLQGKTTPREWGVTSGSTGAGVQRRCPQGPVNGALPRASVPGPSCPSSGDRPI